jgi:predicted amidophosphoribosyltransferase
MAPRWLRKTKPTARQAGLHRDERLANLFGSFSASEQVAGRRCLLIDDIMTTGSTLREASRAIHTSGGTVIAAAVIARVKNPSRAITHHFL